jgi:peptide/nickel transport system substrate-binding protein
MILRASFILCLLLSHAPASELRFALRADPKTFDPLQAADEASETVRYLTAGVLLRFDRATQKVQPELAESWEVRDGGRQVDFRLRRGIRFSDGSAFDADDVVATVQRMSDPALRSPVADTFRPAAGEIRARSQGRHAVSISFPTPIAGVELLFDQLAISPSRSAKGETAVLGPFVVAEHRTGQYVLLRRNPHYWKRDPEGKRLPYLDSVRLLILANRENELLRYRRGELHMIGKLEPEIFERLRKHTGSVTLDSGPSLDSEFLWFNQAPNAAMPGHKRLWFQSRNFRRAISAAINRNDIVRLVYLGHARAAAGPVSQSNQFWFNTGLHTPRHDPREAIRLLEEDGFRLSGQILRDPGGNPVEFSLITNAGSRTRTRIGTMLQEDLKKIGLQLHLVPLEFGSLIERITRTQEYEACLLGFTNVELDPNAQMNVWLSSGTHHAWNPAQEKPATSWEEEIDRLMRVQAGASRETRKPAFDRVQEIVAEQAPIIYLVHPNVLGAASRSVKNVRPSVLPPHLYWNVEHLWVAGDRPDQR